MSKKRVEFDLVKKGSQIIYPDDIDLFSNTVIKDGKMIADYSGELDLTEYSGSDSMTGPRTVSIAEFRGRLTLEERIDLDNFADNTELTTPQKKRIRTALKDIELAGVIDLSAPGMAMAMQFLETCGILAKGRADEVSGRTVAHGI
jgi:hypothetical protein